MAWTKISGRQPSSWSSYKKNKKAFQPHVDSTPPKLQTGPLSGPLSSRKGASGKGMQPVSGPNLGQPYLDMAQVSSQMPEQQQLPGSYQDGILKKIGDILFPSAKPFEPGPQKLEAQVPGASLFKGAAKGAGGKLTQALLRSKTTPAKEWARLLDLWKKTGQRPAGLEAAAKAAGINLGKISESATASQVAGMATKNAAREAAEASVKASVARLAAKWGMSYKEAEKILAGEAAKKGVTLAGASKWLLDRPPKAWIKWMLGVGGIATLVGGVFAAFSTTKSVAETNTMFSWYGADNVISAQGIFFRDIDGRVRSGEMDAAEALSIMQDRKRARDIAIAHVKTTARKNPLAKPSADLILAGVDDQNAIIEFYENSVRDIVLSGEQPETIDEATTRRGEESAARIDEASRARFADQSAYFEERDAAERAYWEERDKKKAGEKKSQLGFGLIK